MKIDLEPREADALSYAARVADDPKLRGEERKIVEDGLRRYRESGVLTVAYEKLKGQRQERLL